MYRGKCMRLTCFAVIVTSLWALASGARAAIVFSLGQADHTLKPKESVVVPVSLQFTGSDATDLSAHGGLLSAAFRVVQTGTPPANPVMPTLLAANTNDFDDPILTPVFLGPSPMQAGIWEFADLTRSSGVLGQSSDPNSRVISLGQVTFAAGASPGQTTFQAEAYDPTLQTTVTFDSPSLTLDGLISPSTVTFNVVPEPQLGLAVVVALPMLAYSARSRAERFTRARADSRPPIR